MAAPLIAIAGTGTGIGKSHLAAALLLLWGRSARVLGYKPVETGSEDENSDAQRLERTSSFHVKPPPRTLVFPDPVSPHLAARRQGSRIHLEEITRETGRLRGVAEGVVLEIAGGLFTPLGPGMANVDLLLAVSPTATLLVAPDRLGVLHDLAATTRAATAAGLVLKGIVLTAPEHPDAATGTNAGEVLAVTPIPVLADLPRGTELAASQREDLARTLARCLR